MKRTIIVLAVAALATQATAKSNEEPVPENVAISGAAAKAAAEADANNRSASILNEGDYDFPASTAAAIYGTRCNGGVSAQGMGFGASVNTGNEVCDFDTVMRGYLALDAVVPDHRDEEGKRPIDKAVEAEDLAFDAAKRRNFFGTIRDWLTVGVM